MIDPLPGDIFRQGQILNNTYEIEGVLGRGGTGEVYRARNRITGRVVAIKALNAEFSGNSEYLDLMRREEEMRAIRHDSVVQYTDCSLSDHGHVYLVMDFIDGPSLNDLMLRGRIDPRDLMIVAHRVAEGLVATHAHGIVHRDLSPDNIILRDGDPEKATIIDFGIAKDTAAGARTIVGNDFAGKYEYAAPEQLDGRAETRSDLYSLGALLLAVFRGEVPFGGSTPGEMVRRKARPLDSQGVPEPLKGLIDWLTAPEIDKRPRDATEVVERLDKLLRPAGRRGRADQSGRGTGRGSGRGSGRGAPLEAGNSGTGRRGLWAALAVVVLGLAGIAGYFTVDWRSWIEPSPERISPYTLEAGKDADGVRLSGHAPDQAGTDAIAAAFAEATGAAAPAGAIALGSGAPENWTPGITALMAALAPLQEWSLSVSDRNAAVQGLAADGASRDAALAAFQQAAATMGATGRASIAVGPRVLPVADVQAVLDAQTTCGHLAQNNPPEGGYPLGATIVVTGELAGPSDAAAVQAALARIIGDRKVRMDTAALNDDLCAIRAVLPVAPAQNLSVWLGYGDTEEPNFSGIYHVGENPIAEIQVPAGVDDGSLWVMVVDNTGKVFHLLPNINQTEHELARVGIVEGGIRRVRVLYPAAEAQADPTKLGMLVSDTDFGKSEIIAIVSRQSLFDIRRPREESVASVAEALKELVATGQVEIFAVASRLIEARP